MTRDEYRAAFRLGWPVRYNGVEYICILAICCRRTMPGAGGTIHDKKMFVVLELLDKCGNGVVSANPDYVEAVNADLMYAAMLARGWRNDEGKNPPESDSSKMKFIPPTVDEVRDYCTANGFSAVDAQEFVDFYGAKGWMVGKNKMKSWHCAVSMWERRARKGAPQQGEEDGGSFDTDDFFKKAVERSYREGLHE